MNARLRLKLIQNGVGTIAPPSAQDPKKDTEPELRLLGEGLDAIIQHTRRPAEGLMRWFFPAGFYDPGIPNRPTVRQRMVRYFDAALLYPLHKDPALADQRQTLGELIRRNWLMGKYPRCRRVRGLMVVPLRGRRRRATA